MADNIERIVPRVLARMVNEFQEQQVNYILALWRLGETRPHLRLLCTTSLVQKLSQGEDVVRARLYPLNPDNLPEGVDPVEPHEWLRLLADYLEPPEPAIMPELLPELLPELAV